MADQLVIRGELWSLSRERMGNFGECEYDSRTLRVHEDLRGHSEVETTVHEVLHAQHADWSEDEVLIRGREIADVLWELLGCRLTATDS